MPTDPNEVDPAARAYAEFDIQAVRNWLKGEPSGLDWILGEGDDGLWAVLSDFIVKCRAPDDLRGSAAFKYKEKALARRIMYWLRQMGMCPEPQDEKGCTADTDAWTNRAEFCSKILVPYESGRKHACAILPKMRKTVLGADVMFGFEPGALTSTAAAAKSAFSKHSALMLNCLDIPVLFEYFAMHARLYMKMAGTSSCYEINTQSYVGRSLSYELTGKVWDGSSTIPRQGKKDKGAMSLSNVYDKLVDMHRKGLSRAGMGAAVTKAVRRECPLLSSDRQAQLVEMMKGTVDRTCRTADAQLSVREAGTAFRACLGAV